MPYSVKYFFVSPNSKRSIEAVIEYFHKRCNFYQGRTRSLVFGIITHFGTMKSYMVYSSKFMSKHGIKFEFMELGQSDITHKVHYASNIIPDSNISSLNKKSFNRRIKPIKGVRNL